MLTTGHANNIIVVREGQEGNWKENGKIFNLTEFNDLVAFRSAVGSHFGVDAKNMKFMDVLGNQVFTFDEVRSKDIVVAAGGAVSTEAMKDNAESPVIPGPKGSLLWGNLYDVFPDPLNQVRALFKNFGPLVTVTLVGDKKVYTDDPKYVEIMSKESDIYCKKVQGALLEMKAVGGRGIFTTNGTDPDWQLGHKILMPAFSPKAIKAYAADMSHLADKCNQCFQQFADANEKVDIYRWMTNYTFETIGKTGFGYDFGLLEDKDKPIHPFVSGMAFCLAEGITRSKNPAVYKKLPLASNYRIEKEIKMMHSIVEDVIQKRKHMISRNEETPKDLLTFMLMEKTAEGKGMDDEMIRDQVLTMLIAGHETTSNTLSWALFELAQRPRIVETCLQEIVNVGIEDGVVPTDKQISELQYIERVIKETLRFHTPVRAISKQAQCDNVLPGGYKVNSGTNCIIALDAMHHNPDVWADPESFDPDRWLPEAESQRSLYSWLPFSIGPRGCIGRQFAIQEAKIGLAKFLRRFSFTALDPEKVSYNPNVITTAPVNMWMKVSPRTNLPKATNVQVISAGKPSAVQATVTALELKPQTVPFPPFTFLYGSNSGTSMDYANTLASKVKKLGATDVVISSLDDFLPLMNERFASSASSNEVIKHALIVVTATYNGTPPDNAEKFDVWMSNTNTLAAQPLAGIHFAVFGCGNKQWRTYQVFPSKMDHSLEALGGTRFVTPGAGDANDDIDGDFAGIFYNVSIINLLLSFKEFLHSLSSEWRSRFTNVVDDEADKKEATLTDGLTIKTIAPQHSEWKSARNTDSTYNSTILVNRELQNVAGSHRSTRHLEISVDKEYLPGDHLEVIPQNDPEIVDVIAQGLGLALDATFIPTEVDSASLASTRSVAASLSVGIPVTLRYLMVNRADLLGPPNRLLVSLFAKKLESIDSTAAEALKLVTSPNSKKEFELFVKKFRTILELMEAFPMVNDISLHEFLCCIPAIVPRRYSIASSPLVLKDRVSLAVGVVQDVDHERKKTYWGQSSGFFYRVACCKNVRLSATVKSCKDTFRAPKDISTPLVMVCAGTGLAPFMGFLQDRQARNFIAPLAETHLFFGCRNEDDFIYQAELKEFEKQGVLTKAHIAFSRSNTGHKKYVQHLLMDEGVLLWNLLHERGGCLYVCGAAGGMAKDVRKALGKVVQQIGGIPETEVAGWLEKCCVEDVWG
ncbi:hypothetical protein HDU79_005313 [Rhizoclosmatium sp. JEL0117]|nr:hypothetical protein HDU79_005313 [Rhizoclosmatium sp. JEL0117]